MIESIVLASGNQGKLKEFVELFATWSVDVLPQSQWDLESAPETGTTFIENAIIKARHAALKTGRPALADDSGLVVQALKGAPGIYSSRYAGNQASDSANVNKLLTTMASQSQRDAYFQCVLVFMRSAEDPTPIIAQGQWHGSISQQPSGEGGFGYAPVFWCPMHQCTAAEMSKKDKNSISHRAVALAQLKKQMEHILG